MKLPLITSYSNLQLRLGYLKIVAALGTRSPTKQQIFEDKIAKLFPAAPAKNGHGFGLAAQKQTTSSSYIGQQFKALGVRRGILNKKNVSEIITLAKAFEFIHPQNCSLYEIAVVVQSLMGKQAATSIIEQSAAAYNPLIIGAGADDFAEKALFTTLIFRADLATAILACAVVGNSHSFHLYDCFLKSAPAYSDKSLLLKTYQLMDEWKNLLGSNALSLTNWKEWVKYFRGDASASPFGGKPEYRMGKRSSYRHHAAPRLEFLVDLGLLQRDSDRKEEDSHDVDSDSGYAYQVTVTTRRFADYLKKHFQPNLDVEKFVRERAIDCCAETHGLSLKPASEAEQVGFLVKGFQAVKREIGSTPMWTAALMSSLLALKDEIRIEIADFYALAKKLSMAEGAKVRLSGGSRFDGEFLITIADDFLKSVPSTTE